MAQRLCAFGRSLVQPLLVIKRVPTTSNAAVTLTINNKRTFATEASPEVYGYYPDPIEHARGSEKKMLLARLAGDDRYEPKIYYRAEKSTRDNPNLVPTHYDDRLIACTCEPDTGHINVMWLRKGEPNRCECGHWFKAVEADEDFA